MLQSWVGDSFVRKQGFPYSFSDRGDFWAAAKFDEITPMTSHADTPSIAEGLVAGMLVATELGWQPVEDLQTGDRVVTFDNGLQRLKSVEVNTLWTAEQQAPRGLWPLVVPARVLGNRTPVRLLPEQAVLIESDLAEDLYGDAFTMISAAVLDGYKGIHRVPPAREMTVVCLRFERDEVVYANGTTLVHCPAPQGDLLAASEAAIPVRSGSAYTRLTEQQARHLVVAMHAAA